jgi:HSP20 family protein
MASNKTIRFRWLQGGLGEVHDVSNLHFGRFAPHVWQPAINAYRCEKCVRICVDLAGVDRSLIDLTITDGRLSIRGVRDVPEPSGEAKHAMQMMAMEIDYGPFEREVQLPHEIDIDKVSAEQENGLLWIYLPLKKS